MSKHHNKCDEFEYCYDTAVAPAYGQGIAPYGAGVGNAGCNNIWSLIVLLIILCKPNVLCNDRAFILILLFWFCGCGCGGRGGFGY
ncbi:hypothetical protein [Clostridium sp. YIM B02551]|uniref:hypothetical protein n=1 Tax=Clostridium sp. YIM B02551 TaxID=2910679 RepID=UPI001EEB26A3|nr:hypothetical protein [Clostridium sp. YIM B02551]